VIRRKEGSEERKDQKKGRIKRKEGLKGNLGFLYY